MKPIRIQLECPYNSSNETKISMYEFLRFYIHCTSNVLFCISAHEHKCAISFIQQCRATATRCFIPWMNQFWTNRVSQWFNGPFRWSHLFRFYWISRFERFVWHEWFSKSFIKTVTCCHLLVVLLSHSITDLNSTKAHSAKYCLIINIDQNSSISGPRRKKKTYK